MPTFRVAFLASAFAGLVALSACSGGDGGSADGGVDGPLPDSAPACQPVAGAATEQVMTTGGPVRGAMVGATWAYLGVPYAAPPVGELRFRAPQPIGCTAVERAATALGPRCPQLDETGAYLGDEDCLHVNVWAPRAAAAARPVMVWIHGGGNAVGSAVDPLYDGRRLAEAGDVVVVSLNYRLGQLGYLADPALLDGGQAGNYGNLDQIAALRWVRDNVAAFGGDPGNVTIFGESAGARNVCTLLAMPASAGLFHRAIMQSGACKYLDTPAEARATADAVAAALGCGADRAACLRGASAEAMVRANHQPVGALDASTYGTVVDGTTVPEQPEAAIRAGRHHAVPFIIGANADETGREAPPNLTATQYESLVRAQFGPIADQVLAQYPVDAFPTPRAAYVRLTTDARFLCPSREIAAAVTANQTPSVFRYLLSYRATVFGAVHGIDIPFLFGTFEAIRTAAGQPYQPTAADLALSTAMQGYWTRFARTGDPGGAPAWPRYAVGDPVLGLDDPITTLTAPRAAACDFWRPYYLAR